MCEWIFLGEQTEAGIVFQKALNPATGSYYRFEPLATRLRGNLASVLRHEIEKRSLALEDKNQGIIRVIGPIFFQDHYWLGWEDRIGRNLFATEGQLRNSLKEELIALDPLINSYSLWQQNGLTVGRPEWRRLSIDGNGIFVVDPKPLFYLSQPCYNPPLALERCRTPEEYHNQPLEYPGDVFYLGLIIYYFLTGQLPFRLKKGWPTQAILNGELINPLIYRPNLPPGLVRVIMSMLKPEPLLRPTLKEVKELWNEYLSMDEALSKSTLNDNLKWRRGFKTNRDLIKSGLKWALSLGLLVLMVFGGYKVYPMLFDHPVASPLKVATNFYQEMGHADLRGKQNGTVPIDRGDFESAVKRRLDMVAALLSRPIFEVAQMRLAGETSENVVIEAELIWWEWSAEGWARRTTRERLVIRKRGKKMILESRKQLSTQS